jgi:hypothetical protein
LVRDAFSLAQNVRDDCDVLVGVRVWDRAWGHGIHGSSRIGKYDSKRVKKL